MDLKRISKKILAFVLNLLFAIYEVESELVMTIVAEVRGEGLTGEEARHEAFRRFRERYKDELRDSLLNLLIEAAVVIGKP